MLEEVLVFLGYGIEILLEASHQDYAQVGIAFLQRASGLSQFVHALVVRHSSDEHEGEVVGCQSQFLPHLFSCAVLADSGLTREILCIDTVDVAMVHHFEGFACDMVFLQNPFHPLAFRYHLAGEEACDSFHVFQYEASHARCSLIPEAGDQVDARLYPCHPCSNHGEQRALWCVGVHHVRPFLAEDAAQLPQAFPVGTERYLAVHGHLYHPDALTLSHLLQLSGVGRESHHFEVLVEEGQLPL